MLSRLCACINKPDSFILLSLGSLGGKANYPVWLVTCWDIRCMVMQHDRSRCSLPVPASSILPSFIAVDVRLAQRPASFSHKAFVSLVTRANGICYNLSSGHLQGWCGRVELGVGMCWVCGHYWDVAETVGGST